MICCDQGMRGEDQPQLLSDSPYHPHPTLSAPNIHIFICIHEPRGMHFVTEDMNLTLRV